jgi:iron(III) transport system substrate-binding protein
MAYTPASARNRMSPLNRRTFNAAAFAGAGALAASQRVTFATTEGMPASTPDATALANGDVTMYCGRNEALVGALVDRISEATGVTLAVRYGSTAELAAQILEEGENSPAGLFFSQDAGALGALAKADRLTTLPDDVLQMVDERFQDTDGRWIGLSGRARVIVYQPDLVEEGELPESILDLPESGIGPIGIAPSNASFQTFVTALRLTEGEDGARAWLEALQGTDMIIYESNGPIVDAVAAGEAAVGLVNHYYLYEKLAENPDITAKNHYFTNGDIGGLINVAGIGILAGSGQETQAEAVVRYLLGEDAQHYFAEQTFEYPLASGVSPVADLPPLDDYEHPDVNLNDLDDLEGTLMLLTELGLI